MGPEVGDFIRALHESHGVVFHLGENVSSIEAARGQARQRRNGRGRPHRCRHWRMAGDRLHRARRDHGDKGIVVDEYLQTSAPGVFAAGDLARWPDPHTGERIRVEHWVVAERQGQVAARNMLGRRERFDAVPFFWSQHYDVTINYVGHASHWDAIDVSGDLGGQDCTLTFRRQSRALAVATIGRDRENLEKEVELESVAEGRNG